ncbi:MAG TPA: GAF domain-containing protein, partial [Candidatus Saccharimonadales bacterium]|nr:GAF domain-containing protein [Candidatus Saccharimonadales bacterium]
MPVTRRTSPDPGSPPVTAESSSDPAALRGRIAELEARDARHERSIMVRDALYRIAEASSAATDLQDFYRTVHRIVGELMDARNFYIALYDADREAINFPYYVDTVDTDLPDPAVWEPMGVGDASGVTAYVLRTGKPLLLDPALTAALEAGGEIQPVGASNAGDWVGAPLVTQGRTLGVIAVQSYTSDLLHTESDRDLLAFVGQHIGSALSRARAIEETRQRNAELALINEIGEALAQQLEFGAIIDLVG